MTFLHIRYFCMVAECQSISREAKALIASQTALSTMIRYLEDELGLSLIHIVADRRSQGAAGGMERAPSQLGTVSGHPRRSTPDDPGRNRHCQAGRAAAHSSLLHPFIGGADPVSYTHLPAAREW